MKFPAVVSIFAFLIFALGGALFANESVLTNAQTLAPAENFPRCIVPGQEPAMHALNAMHRLHYPPVWLDYPHRDPAAGLCTLWDEWLSGACLWADTAGILVCDGKVTITQRLKNSFNHKIIDAEGYVATHQHEGIGHILGWPFPYWIGSPGAVGVHFSAEGTKSAVLTKGAPVATKAEGWTLVGAEDRGIGEVGWQLALSSARASATVALGVIDPRVSPFMQLRWSAKNLGAAQPSLEWETEEQPGFSAARRIPIPLPPGAEGTVAIEMLPLYRHPLWQGKITRLRLNFDNVASGAEVVVQALFSQYDTRHNINNFDYIRGAIDVFLWTGDLEFMRAAAAVTRGLNCILATQILVQGRRTVWCQQHDPLTLAPTSARNYEMPSQSSGESAGLVLFLMELPNPSPEVVTAVHAAAAWFEKTALQGVIFKPAPDGSGRRLQAAPGAPSLWPRYAEIGSDRPLFGDRDKTIHDDVNEISQERRNGYAWFGDGPKRALDHYRKWAQAHPRAR